MALLGAAFTHLSLAAPELRSPFITPTTTTSIPNPHPSLLHSQLWCRIVSRILLCTPHGAKRSHHRHANNAHGSERPVTIPLARRLASLTPLHQLLGSLLPKLIPFASLDLTHRSTQLATTTSITSITSITTNVIISHGRLSSSGFSRLHLSFLARAEPSLSALSMPIDQSPAKLSSPSRSRSLARNSTAPAISNPPTSSTPGTSPKKPSPATTTPRRSSRISSAARAADDSSDSRSETSFSSTTLASAPATPATAVSASASNPSSTSRKSRVSAGPSPASSSSTLANTQPTPSRVGSSVSTSDQSNPARQAKGKAKAKSKGKGKAKASPAPSTSASKSQSAPSASTSAKGKRKADSSSQPASKKSSPTQSTGGSSNKRPKLDQQSNPSTSNQADSASPTSSRALRSRDKMTGVDSNASDTRATTRSKSSQAKSSSKSKRAPTGTSARPSADFDCSDSAAQQDADVHMSDLADQCAEHPDVEMSGHDHEDDDEGLDAFGHHDDDDDDDDEDEDEDEHDDEEHDDGEGLGMGGASSRSNALGGFEDDEDDGEDDDDDGHGAGVFGLNLRAMAGYMSGLSNRFRSLLASLRNESDPTAQMVALQDLSELLSVSTEDTLAGYFPTDAFVKELVYILGGPKPERHDLGSKSKIQAVDDEDDGLDDDMRAALATAAAADMEDSGEKMLLACRCLANLIEAMPYAAHGVVSHGAIPVLTSKLMEITFIDLAEQVLQTLEKVSQDYPGAIVREGGLSAILQYLDFFNIHIQRTAMTAAANCCRKLTPDSLASVRDVMPIVQNVLTYSDQRLVESACKCVVRVVDSYRLHPELLEQLLTGELLAALNNLLLPASSPSSSNTTLGASTYTDVLKALGTACRSSPQLAVALLENNIVETLYHLLTGSPAPAESASAADEAEATKPHGVQLESEQATGPGSAAETAAVAVVPDDDAAGANSTVAVADMAVLQNLAQRPKEQIQEALSLIGELLPPLPRDGVFDPRAYTEKAYLKRTAKQGSASAESASAASSQTTKQEQAVAELVAPRATDAESSAAPTPVRPTSSRSSSTRSKAPRTKSDKEVARDAAQAKRVEMLHRRTALVKRFTHLVLPTLVEVYAASVALHVRHKAINGILKIISFVDPDSLAEALDNVPLASFLAAILSSREHPTLAVGALQIVELLTEKLPSLYTALLRREGVMWEIDDIASQTPSARPSDKTIPAGGSASTDAASSVEPLTLPRSGASQSESGVGGAGMGLSSGSSLARLLAAAAGSGASSAQMEALGLRPASSSSSASAFNAQSAADATDASIWRARVLRDKFAAEANSSGGARSAAQALEHIKDLVKRLYDAAVDGKESDAVDVLQQVGSLFSRNDDPISSFELLRSGLVEALYSFATQSDGGIALERRRWLLVRTLMQTDDKSNQNGATVLVRRLQEALSRLENVDITTALSAGGDDARKSPSAMLGRQLRLRLQAEDATDIPRSCNNIIVTIHAVATFQSLSDYLRPKIAVSSAAAGSGAGAGGSAPSRLSSVLAAFAAATGSGGFPELGGSKETKASSSVDKDTDKQAKGGDAAGSGSGAEGSAAAEKADSKAKEAADNSDAKDGEASGSAQAGKDRDSEARAEARALARHLFGDDELPAESGEGANKAKDPNAADDELQSDEALARSLMEGLLHGADFDDEEGFSDEEGFDEEILQGEIPVDGDTGASATAGDGADAADKTINLDVEKEGGRIVAKTPEGTRIATPSNGAGTPKPAEASSSSGAAAASSSSTPSPSKPSSYASALQKKPTDWHLEFSLGSESLSLDTTVYGAVHRYEAAQSRDASQSSVGTASSLASAGGKHIWSNVYTVRFKKVSGAEERAKAESTPEPTSAESAAIELPASIKEDAPYAKLLQLLAVLHSLNMEWREVTRAGVAGGATDAGDEIPATSARALAESAFVNNKLTAKLNRQLEEPLIVASACLPAWSTDLPRHFPFLFPFEARFAFLQSTSFGYARLLTRWQALHSRNQDAGSSASRLDDSFGFLGRLQRQKVRISRANLLASAFKVFELYGSNSSVLEVEYFEEVGTGLGPTLEFYSLVSKEFARRDLELWRDSRSGGSAEDGSAYVFSPLGLFPAPLITAQGDEAKATTASASAEGGSSSVSKRLQAFRILGQFVAKALLDSRIIDCNFSAVFMRAALNQHVAPTLATLSAVDATLARALASLREMKPDEVEAVGLDFTLPGYEAIELHPGGRDESVTGANVEQYVWEVLDMTLQRGIRPAVRAFRQGFNLIFPISAMSSFTADELVMLFGNTDEDWSESTLVASIKPDHGLNADSASFRDIVAIMASFGADERREFLQWLTGSPKLPIGGFAGLHPQLTIVKRPHEAPLTPDDYLPSVMTCVNYLKMPSYSSRDKMRERLHTAMKEGSTSFHLS